MEAVSAAKMRKSQHRAIAGRAYARAAASILARASATQGLAAHPLAQAREVKKVLYIVITSDKGLAGALNSAVLRRARNDMRERSPEASAVGIIAVGRKAQDYFLRRGFVLEAYHHNTDALSRELIESLVAEAATRFVLGSYDEVRIAYQNFVSTFEQRPTVRTIFPLSLDELGRVVKDILPVRGQAHSAEDVGSRVANYTVEPSEQEVMDAVIPKLAGIFVYHALLESQASEHSARMVAMKGASDKAQEMQHALQLRFNKARQAAITREVSEIIAGQL